MSRLHDDILACLAGERPQTFSEVFDSLDFEGTRGELRSELEALVSKAKLIKGPCADGFTRYSLTAFERAPIAPAIAKSPAPTTSHAQPTDVASAAVVVSETSKQTLPQRVERLLESGPVAWMSVAALVDLAAGELTSRQVTNGLQFLRIAGRAEMMGARASARWRLTSSGPQATAESVQTAEAVCAPEGLPSTTPEAAAVPAPPVLPGALSSLPANLLARIESIAVDIEAVTGEAIDAGLGAGALKSLVTAGGSLRRALLPFNLRN